MASNNKVVVRLNVDSGKPLDVHRFNEVYTALGIISKSKPIVTAHCNTGIGMKAAGAIPAVFGDKVDDVFAGYKGVPVVSFDQHTQIMTIEVDEGGETTPNGHFTHGQVLVGFAGHGIDWLEFAVPSAGSDYRFSE